MIGVVWYPALLLRMAFNASTNAAFENEARLWPHIKEEVGDTQIWQETELLSEHLIIFAGRKVGIEAEICFGPYEFPQILFAVGGLVIVFRENDFGVQIQQFAHQKQHCVGWGGDDSFLW